MRSNRIVYKGLTYNRGGVVPTRLKIRDNPASRKQTLDTGAAWKTTI